MVSSYLCLVPVVLLLLVLFVSALFNRVPAKLGVRNVFRRKENTALVVAGLMVSTSIIGASFIVGDTMDNMVTSMLIESYYESDLHVGYVDPNQGRGDINATAFADLSASIGAVDNVDGVAGIFAIPVSAFDLEQGLSEPGIMAVGYRPDEFDDRFGDFLSGGTPVPDDTGGPFDVYINDDCARALDAREGDHLRVYGASGEWRVFNVTRVIDSAEKGNWGGGNSMYMDLDTLDRLMGKPLGTVNTITVTCEGDHITGMEHIPQVAGDVEDIIGAEPYRSMGYEILVNKKDVLDDASSQISLLTSLFLVFGSFSVIAGIVLIINIFTMLAEERKSELGIARAVGTTRSMMRKMFMYEGAVYTVLSVIVGAAMSIPLAYGIILAFNSVFGSFGPGRPILSYYTVETSSLVYAISIGFAIAMVTIFLTTFKISRLNIVRAIRNIPEPPPSKKSRRMLYLGAAGIAVGITMFLLSFPTNRSALFYPGLSMLILGTSVVVRRFVGERLAYSVGSLLTLLLWSVPYDTGMEGDMEMFVLSGMFMVSSAVILLIYNFDTMVDVFNALFRWIHRSLRPILKMAVAYPTQSRFKTGLMVFIFTLVIFTITVMSMIVGMNGANIEKFKEEISGGVDVFATCSTMSPVDNISAAIGGNENLSRVDFTYAEGFRQGYFLLHSEALNRTGPESPFYYPVTGVTPEFVENTRFTFQSYDGRFSGENAVWAEVLGNTSVVVIDSMGGAEQNYGPHGTFVGSVGDTVDIVLPNGTVHSKLIIGVLDSILLNGLMISDDAMTGEFNVTGQTLFMFKLGPGEDIHEVAIMLEREFLPFRFQTLEISSLVDDMFAAQDSIFTLFNGFIGLGLIIGISGLGIITIRSVHERRQQIGMLRAIGFRRSWVVLAFALEASMITVIGIVIGIALGIDVGFNLWWSDFRPQDYDFFIPWFDILLYGGIAFAVTLIATFIPSRKAAKVSPAEALRYE